MIDGIGAMSGYGILLMVNTQIVSIIRKPSLPPDQRYIRASVSLLFLVFSGLNVAFSKMIEIIVFSHLFDYNPGLVVLSLMLPVILLQVFSILELVFNYEFTNFQKRVIKSLMFLYIYLAFQLLGNSIIPRTLDTRIVVGGMYLLSIISWIILGQRISKKSSLGRASRDTNRMPIENN